MSIGGAGRAAETKEARPHPTCSLVREGRALGGERIGTGCDGAKRPHVISG